MNHCVMNALYWSRNSQSKDDYFKNTVVSLCSIQGDSVDKILVTNDENIPDEYATILDNHGVKVMECSFDTYVFPKGTPWEYGFYKICALEHVTEYCTYDKILLLDADTLCIRPLDEAFWRDVDTVMLYRLPASIEQSDRRTFLDECHRFFSNQNVLEYYGGEFIGGPRESLIQYFDICKNVYQSMKDNGYVSVRGDEFIWSYAASSLPKVKTGNPYILRVEITQRYYATETRYVYPDVKILHALCEKQTGLIYIYNYLRKKGHIPPLKTVRRVFGLPKAKRRLTDMTMLHVKSYIKKIMKKG